MRLDAPDAHFVVADVDAVTFLSRKFSPIEMNYYIHDREIVLIVFAFEE